MFGGGFSVTTLELVAWLADKEVVYWGDIDTHGYAILDRLRARLVSARSILMDRRTLLAHRNQLTTEDAPTNAVLPHLTPEEAAIYRDLVEDRYGSAVRLEQERVRFALVRSALAAWTNADSHNPTSRAQPGAHDLRVLAPTSVSFDKLYDKNANECLE